MNEAQKIISRLHQPNVESFDITDFEDMDSGKVFLKNPKTGAPSPYYVEFAGPEHALRKRMVMDKQRRMRAGLQKTGKLQLQDPLEDDEEMLDMLVATALGWNLTANGGPIEFSKDAIRQLLTDPKRRWLRDQLQVGFEERENFISRSVST